MVRKTNSNLNDEKVSIKIVGIMCNRKSGRTNPSRTKAVKIKDKKIENLLFQKVSMSGP
jgi:hypothetical protein